MNELALRKQPISGGPFQVLLSRATRAGLSVDFRRLQRLLCGAGRGAICFLLRVAFLVVLGVGVAAGPLDADRAVAAAFVTDGEHHGLRPLGMIAVDAADSGYAAQAWYSFSRPVVNDFAPKSKAAARLRCPAGPFTRKKRLIASCFEDYADTPTDLPSAELRFRSRAHGYPPGIWSGRPSQFATVTQGSSYCADHGDIPIEA